MNTFNFQNQPIAVFSDFDGTIAHPDTINFLTEIHGGLEFRRKISRRIRSGEITLRQGISAEISTIKGSLNEVLEFLIPQVRIDKHFPLFVNWCLKNDIPVTILSAGIKEVIEQILAPHNLNNLQLRANSLEIVNGCWTLNFLDESPWGHDKSTALIKANSEGYKTVFLGDGLSDLRAAEKADLVFSKRELTKLCQENSLPCIPFENFSQINIQIKQLLMKGTIKYSSSTE